MKKKLIAQAVLVILMTMILGVGSAMAAMGQLQPQPPYSSWCNAFYNQNYDEGETSASISIPGKAEAQADQWKLGSRVQVSVNKNTPFKGLLKADASFTQQFKVTKAGEAAITFSYDGELSASNMGNGTFDGKYGIGFDVEAFDDKYGMIFSLKPFNSKNNSKYYSGYLEGVGDKSYSDTFDFSYDFDESEVGSTFFVTLDLSTYLGAKGSINYEGDGFAEFSANFFNTARIDTVTGGLAPVSSVPIPGAIWLMGSGLFGFVAVKRRKNS